jgi:hypothetical protein
MKGFAQMKKDEQNFESMVQAFKRKINELQVPPSQHLTEKEWEVLRRDKELRSKSANYRMLGEDAKADGLEREILTLQDKAIAIREKLAKAPSGQQEIYNTIANTSDSKLHKEALNIYRAGLDEYEKVLAEIEASEAERVKVHNAVVENAKQRGDLERNKVNLYFKLKEIEKALPVEEHKAQFPQKAPEWSHFLPDEDQVGKAYGRRPFLIQR